MFVSVRYLPCAEQARLAFELSVIELMLQQIRVGPKISVLLWLLTVLRAEFAIANLELAQPQDRLAGY